MKLTPNYTEKSISQSSFFDYKTPRALSPGPSLARTPSNKESKKPDIPIILVWFHVQLSPTNNVVTSPTSGVKKPAKVNDHICDDVFSDELDERDFSYFHQRPWARPPNYVTPRLERRVTIQVTPEPRQRSHSCLSSGLLILHRITYF